LPRGERFFFMGVGGVSFRGETTRG
jgi:hypothetical protein